MINEEISNRVVNIEVNVLKATYQEILSQVKKLQQRSKQHGGLDKFIKTEGNEVKLKDMVKKGQLEEINIKDGELKELKKELNKHGVKFSVMKDKETGTHSVFFQAEDTKVMNKAFQNVLSNIEKKEKNKESIHKNIEKFKEMAKNTISKDKVKNKQKEQSL
ncbi:TPA: PcfB family protein [Streptococcus agalactiae]|uniref:Conjugal transfer protein n=1 Tax=Streptococcus agalactiae TaxID=1311 RepID=A0AAW3HS64_STRAG|nr:MULTISPECIES: PcfB family protein [Streptococcus]EPT50657.1 conjugal transfer protein [Streptococcus agalactiae CCUG 19094]EPU03049.1 conjugal transfer protein [Streptococcus agalactiae BSU167]EPU44085.1 conjugal transfer protein [Streptococcus agalactiae str. Gottschalk 1003A]EPU69478.1 conjugal transfer protein [Streptococcus agalactiae GB00092]EPV04048.1 conjugal transfer protein [Streptococcus agalactiae GB00543]